MVVHVPELKAARNPFGRIESVTLRRMLSHESGLQNNPPGADWSTGSYEGQPERNIARAEQISTGVRPNAQTKYSNIAYQLLGEVVARISGRPYPAYICERILDPLGMGATAFEPLPNDLAGRKATGYNARIFSDEFEIARPSPEAWAEGGLWSCVEDIARWVSFQLQDGNKPVSDVLCATTRKEMQTARYLSDETWTSAYGIGWASARRDEVIWIQHSGALYGFTSNVCFDPKENVGAIVLLNGIGNAAQLAMDLGTVARKAARCCPVCRDSPPNPRGMETSSWHLQR